MKPRVKGLDAVKGCMEIGKNFPGGYSLMPACERPSFTLPVSVQAILKTARLYGRSD